jgi:hypothetical protein
LVLAGIGVGFVGSLAAPVVVVRGDVTEEPRREAFQPGALVNQTILKEMAATLKRIEDHVQEIEKKIPNDPSRPAAKSKSAGRK